MTPAQSRTVAPLPRCGRYYRLMRVWLLHMGETLPVDGPDARVYRYGLLAQALTNRGHEVVRFAPTFNHVTKEQRAGGDEVHTISDQYRIHLIYGKGYRRHVGYARWSLHRSFARRFLEIQRALPRPQIIICALPTPDICHAIERLHAESSVPYVVDIRDLWPDVLVQRTPKWTRGMVRGAVRPIVAANRSAFSKATALCAVSKSYLDWALMNAGRSEGPYDRVFPLGYAPPIVDSAEDAERRREHWEKRLPPAAVTVVFSGMFNRQSDLTTVLRAVETLNSRDSNAFRFVLCGDGPMFSQVRDAADDMPNVILPGWVNTSDLSSILALADIAVAPYPADSLISLPNKLFEYLAQGLPVVTSLGSEFRGIIETAQCGAYFRPGDSSALAEALQLYRAKPETLLAQGRAAKNLWASTYSSSIIYPRMASWLEDLACSGESV